MQIASLMEQFDSSEALVSQECDSGQAKLFILRDEVLIERMIEFLHNDIRVLLKFMYLIDNRKRWILLYAEHDLELLLNQHEFLL
jgi:hypothetical protein